jgi:transcription elongation GreA/GreB family factor
MGKKAGDKVTVTAPAGELHFKVLEVARANH